MAVSLGVGSSTLAVLNFFVALKDGKIDEQERSLMEVVYVVLRVAMVAILVTTLLLAAIYISQSDLVMYMSSFKVAFWTLIFVLYLNAFLMTKHVISSKFGPAIQAATWYTMGVIMALMSLGLQDFYFYQFAVGYMLAIVSAVVLINAVLQHLRKNNKPRNVF